MSLLRGLFRKSQVVPVLRITGPIDNMTAFWLDKDLELVRRNRGLACLAVVIDSQGGSGVQADLIAEKLRATARELHVPLYAFVTGKALAAAALPLFAADKTFCSRSSLLGKFHASTFAFALTEDFGLKRWVTPTEGESLKKDFRLFGKDPQADLRFEANMNRLLADDSKTLQNAILELKQLKADPQVWQEVSEGRVLTGEEAVRARLVDEIGTYVKILERDFPDCERVFIRRNRLRETLLMYSKAGSSIGIIMLGLALVAYKVLSYLAKLYVATFLAPKNPAEAAARAK